MLYQPQSLRSYEEHYSQSPSKYICGESKMNLPIVVRKEVWVYLKSQGANFNKQVRQSIDKLQKKQSDSGSRRKKLIGKRNVWEARINSASRLLYTYRQSHDSNGEIKKFIAVETICKKHDDVSNQADIIGRRNWRASEEPEVIGNSDLEYGLSSIDEQEEIDSWEAEDLGIRTELPDELLDTTHWLVLEPNIIESEEEWQKEIDSESDLRLRITMDESKVIHTDGNILLSGNAGTGKTTVGLYRLAQALQVNNHSKCLYVAYNPILVKESKEQFKKLSNNREDFPGLEFLTITDLCSQIIKNSREDFDYRLIDYSYFYQHYSKNLKSKKYRPSLVWNEIRSIIKGAKLNNSNNTGLMTQSEYEDLGRNRSEVIEATDRPEIYQLAKWYQKHLNRNSEKIADEMDLAQKTLQLINCKEHNIFTLIICDEAQDLVEVQLEILIKLLAKNGKILFAGDINQMISPSGFRWADLKTRLHLNKLTRPIEVELPFNFRSTANLVSLSISILRLKSQILYGTRSKIELPVKTSGKIARLVQASSEDIKQINLGAADAIIVRTEERKEKLTKILGIQLIFTIEESKGLEFDTVYLVDFFENSSELWTKFLSNSSYISDTDKKRSTPELRLEFNLLYVAITRARRIINICEPQISYLWSRPEISESLVKMGVEEAFCEAQSTTRQDWYQAAIYYRDARRLGIALECASKSENETLKQEIELEIELGYLPVDCTFEEVARLLINANKYSKAAEYFEKAQFWQDASKAWEMAGNFLQKSECQIKYLIEKGDNQEAAKILVSIGRYTEAEQILGFENYWDNAADIWNKMGDKKRQEKCLLKSANFKQSYHQYRLINSTQELQIFNPKCPKDYFNRDVDKYQSGDN